MMNRSLWIQPLAVLALTTTGLAGANSLPVPTVDYSATRVIESKPGPFVSKIYVSEGKERSETTVGEKQMITIIRPDKNIAWILMPATKTYQEVGVETAVSYSHQQLFPEGEFKKLAQETLDGIKATRYQVLQSKAPAGSLWLSEEGIPLKAEKAADEVLGLPPISLRLQDVQVGKQDAALFELPAGYQKFVK